jgi:hypothetical protein
MPQRLKPYNSRVPSKFEMAFSLGVVSLVTLLGLLILTGAFRIDPNFKVTLGIVLVGYGLVRFWMLKSRYRSRSGKEDSVQKLPKEDDEKLRNF